MCDVEGREDLIEFFDFHLHFFLLFSFLFPLFFPSLAPGKYSKHYSSKPVKGPDFTVVLQPMEIRTFDLTVQPN